MHYIISFGVILGALVCWFISVRRSLAGMIENINNAMAQIGIQIFSQWELLICVLDLMKWYAPGEREIIIDTMKSRRCINKNSRPADVDLQRQWGQAEPFHSKVSRSYDCTDSWAFCQGIF
ncbi:MAG: hypothetical protein K0Q48_2693 [Bacillota bacterium]|nr:hypothetical protein [Bacillota bacterium]